MLVLRIKKIKQINENNQLYLLLFVAFNITGGNSNSKQTVTFWILKSKFWENIKKLVNEKVQLHINYLTF